MNIFNGITSTSFIVNIPVEDIAESITAEEVANRFTEACDTVKGSDCQPMTEAEASEAVFILKKYFTSFSSDESITLSATMVLSDGKISFAFDFRDVLVEIISAKGWKSHHGYNEGWYFQIRDNSLVKISYKGNRGSHSYDTTIISSDDFEISLFKTVMMLIYGRD